MLIFKGSVFEAEWQHAGRRAPPGSIRIYYELLCNSVSSIFINNNSLQTT